jgi:hypothetical protein
MTTNLTDTCNSKPEIGGPSSATAPCESDHDAIARAFFRYTFNDIAHFSRVLVGRPLRSYQLAVARAVLKSVQQGQGAIFTVEMARQMGKNELSAHLEAYLLYRHQRRGGTIVKCAPTLSPQTLISRLRLESILDRPWLAPYWKRTHTNQVTVGKARVMFLSAHEQSNVVGATADLLLEVDEAQDVDEEKFAKDFLPMATAQNATIVLYGTPWTKNTLLAKYKALNLAHAENTGEQRHFSYPWQAGASENPRYGAAVKAQIRQRGEDDLVIRTQYRLEEVDDATGFFTPPLQAALQGAHTRQHHPRPDAHYVAAVDVAGEATDTAQRNGRSRRDSTVVLIGERVWRHDPVLGFALPAVQVVDAYQWTGLPTTEQYARLVRLLGEEWRVQRAVIDATGLGDALARFLQARLGSDRIEPFTFTAQSKSALGYDLRALVGNSRLQLWAADGSSEYRECWQQVKQCQLALHPGNRIAFQVPDGQGHDDYVIALALLTRTVETGAPPAVSVALPPREYSAEGY